MLPTAISVKVGFGCSTHDDAHKIPQDHKRIHDLSIMQVHQLTRNETPKLGIPMHEAKSSHLRRLQKARMLRAGETNSDLSLPQLKVKPDSFISDYTCAAEGYFV
eukprot:s1572_g13.t1